MREPISANKAVEGRLRVEGIFLKEAESWENVPKDMILILWEGEQYTYTRCVDTDTSAALSLHESNALFQHILSDEEKAQRQVEAENEKQAKAAREAELTEARERSELARLRHKYEG